MQKRRSLKGTGGATLLLIRMSERQLIILNQIIIMIIVIIAIIAIITIITVTTVIINMIIVIVIIGA